ncbi:glycosyltransferase [Effusibacillus lacus]|uniref:Glycosyl transferase family 1 n=1 Tax=Effusibacillus lacus TaxID=1348429 RepID=A0A292YRR1_9BACL|nr:glycosyltransferase [Effusibacillus lacus]TCS74939.1 glycosyltransferase involved in cell wall biosynthesis [Effusibacillus lacus]GAX91609.1 hypothetical protein EFBL_3299 [Effusibacillus lacus]
MNLSLPPILYLPCFDFHNHRQRPQQLLYHLSQLGLDVIYCNVTQEKREPFLRLNDHFIICQDIDALDWDREYIMWLTHGPYVELLSRFQLPLVVGDIADASTEEFAAFAEWHDSKIAAADMVLCASEMIYQDTKGKHPYVRLIRNAADYDHFAAACNPEIEYLPHETTAKSLCGNTAPVIGFWGAVASWLDYDLIAYLAKQRPNYLFAFVGQITTSIPHPLLQTSNVLWIGNRDYSELPAFARQFDAAVIPFQIREVTRAANPVKLYEYLAAGLPVISTDLPEVRCYPHVRIGRTKEEFLQQIDEALMNDRTTEKIVKRQSVAKKESWRVRAEQIAREISFLYGKKRGNRR